MTTNIGNTRRIIETTDRKTRSHRVIQVTTDATSLSDSQNKVSDTTHTHRKQCPAMATNAEFNPETLSPLERMIQNLSDKFDNFERNIATIDVNIKGIREEMRESQVNTNNKLDELTEQNKHLENKLNSATERIETLENLFYDTYTKSETDLKNKQAMNIIIRGVPEANGEQLHQTMSELLGLVGTITYIQTNGAQRLGRDRTTDRTADHANKTQKPRPIKLRCATTLQKGEIFRALNNIKTDEKFKNITLANEPNKDEMIARKEVQMLYNEAITKPNVQAKMKGSRIEINGKTYNKSNFDQLPLGLSLESAATAITTNDLAFQGHCSPYSNLHLLPFLDETCKYNCVEQRFGYIKATTCNEDTIGAKILCETSPYRIYELTKSIPTNDEWNRIEYETLKESVSLKVEQNPDFKRHLLRHSNKAFHEATYNKKYGAGFTIAEARAGNSKAKPGYQDLMGKIYTEIITSLKDT